MCLALHDRLVLAFVHLKTAKTTPVLQTRLLPFVYRNIFHLFKLASYGSVPDIFS